MDAALQHLGDLTLPELGEWIVARGEKPFRAKQIFRWLNAKGVSDWEGMTDLPARSREALRGVASLRGLEDAGVEAAGDGTEKLLFRTRRGHPIEAVVIPMPSGGRTLCVSSQAGCKLGCTFCLTGALDLPGRSLTGGEIVDQVRAAFQRVGDPLTIDNLVFMGMGEPLLNYAQVKRAVAILTDPQGRGLSTRRITVSTAGVAPLIPHLGAETGVQLAVSLNAPRDDLRDRLMPINRRWNLAALKAALEAFPLPPRRRITIEYVLLAGVNDQDADARDLAAWLKGLRVKVNLIPFNEHPAAPYRTPSEARVDRFAGLLLDRHLSVQVRRSRGSDVKAACGQLGASLDYQSLLPDPDPSDEP